jgi:hypothetical protein
VLIPYPLEPPPALPPLDDPWDSAEADLDSGRRGRYYPGTVLFHEGPTLDALDLLGPLEVRDRRIMALEEPLFVWDVEATGPLRMTAAVRFAEARIRYERAVDGASLWLGAETGTDELIVRCYGGTVEAVEEGDVIRLTALGQDRMRLVVVAAWGEEDRSRTLRSLARKGIPGVVAQQVRHNEMLAQLGVKVTTPDPDIGLQLEFDKLEFESRLQEHRTGHRMLVEEPYGLGYMLLSLGLREPVRDTLRAPFDDPDRRRLFAAYAAWAGADDFVHRHWRRLVEGVRAAEQGYRTLQLGERYSVHQEGAFDLVAVAEALADREAVELFEEVCRELEYEPMPGTDEVETALDFWGIEPLALEGAVHLRPALPELWPEMTLERLRIGDSSLDVRVRRRPSGVAVKVRVTRGPPVVVHLAPKLGYSATGVLVGAEQLAGGPVSLTVEDEVEALWTR